MKKMSLLAALCAMGFVTGCSDDSSPDPTKAEQCSVGLNTDCLVGSWDALGVINKQDGSKIEGFDFSANPGKLTFNKDGSFQYDLPAASADASLSDCNPIYGSWSVDGSSLQMTATINAVCIYSPEKTLAAKVEVAGAEVKLSFGEMWIFYNNTDENVIRNFGTEVFSISASAK